MTIATRIEPELRTLKKQPVAIIQITTTMGGIPAALGAAFGELEAAIRMAETEIVGPPFARYLTFGPEAITLEAGFPIARKFPASGRVVMSKLPGCEVATVLHVGPYERLATTYNTLTEWVALRGREPAGPMWEAYLSDPAVEPDPETWRTEVFLPLR
jgi:effector-binding domain-containing protein